VPGFYETGIWYDYFSGESLEVTDAQQSLWLPAGEFRVFTDQQLETPDFVGVEDTYDFEDQGLFVFPNPATEALTIRFNLSQPAAVSLKLYDITGQEVFRHEAGTMAAGSQELNLLLDGLAAGIYLAWLQHGQQINHTKVMVR